MSRTNLAHGNAPDRGFEFLDTPVHPQAAALHDFWLKKCAGRAMPARSDIDLGELRRWAPNIVISEPVNAGADYRLRLFGSALVEITGEERTGKLVSEIGSSGLLAAGNIRARWRAILSRAFETHAPVFARARASVEGREHVLYHGLALPLSVNGTPAAQCLGALFTEYRSA